MILRDKQTAPRRPARRNTVATGLLLALALSGCSIFGGGDDKGARLEAAEEVYQVGVNAYLWRATLDTISFMPLLEANHNSGVVLTDWRSNPKNTAERTKAEVYIIGKKLSADSLRVKIHRQQKQGDDWIEIGPRPGAEFQLANAILMQARLLRRNNAPLTN